MSTSAEAESPIRPSGSYHHGNLRAALVEAGLSLLEQGSTGDFSLRELARQVGVSANATYRHFASKEALMLAMAAEGYRRFTQALVEGAMCSDNPRERFLGAGRGYVGFARKNPALFRLMFGRFTTTHESEELFDAGQIAYMALSHGVAGFLGKPVDDPRVQTASVQCWSLVHGLTHLILDGQLDKMGDIDALIASVLRPPD